MPCASDASLPSLTGSELVSLPRPRPTIARHRRLWRDLRHWMEQACTINHGRISCRNCNRIWTSCGPSGNYRNQIPLPILQTSSYLAGSKGFDRTLKREALVRIRKTMRGLSYLNPLEVSVSTGGWNPWHTPHSASLLTERAFTLRSMIHSVYQTL